MGGLSGPLSEVSLSFLAKLRSHQNAATAGPRLEYHLFASAARLRLSLVLVEPERFGAKPQPFYLQRSHLLHPPAFLTAGDLALLNELVGASSTWLGGQGDVLPLPLGAWLQRIAANGQLYWQDATAVRAVQVTAWPAFELAWQCDTDGSQRLAIVAPPGCEVLAFAGGVAAMERATATLRVAEHDRARAALAVVGQTIAPAGVAEFFAAESASWRDAGWPLPQPLEPQSLEAKVVPVLYARNTWQGTREVAQVTLRARWHAENFCCETTCTAEPQHLLVGERLFALNAQASMAAPGRELIAAMTQQLHACGPAIWQVASGEQWRALLAAQAQAWRTLGVVLVYEPGFSFPWRLADELEIAVQRTSAGTLAVDLRAAVAGEPISLKAVLAELLGATLDAEHLRVTMPNGEILLLPRKQAVRLLDELGDWLLAGGPPLPRAQAYRLSALGNEPGVLFCGDVAPMQEAAQLWQQPAHHPLAAGLLRCQLRPYQWLGVYWLLHLHRLGWNGLLADDMGLGKTLQTLAFLSQLKHEGKLQQPVLLLAPTSLLGNWLQETARFAPSLKAQLVHGPERWQQPLACDLDLCITSYGSFANDLEQWRANPPGWLILDEAQTIKNPTTRIRRAVAELEVPHKLCLSGTPVENHLGEMWSLLDFLNPGILGSQKTFKAYYQKPVEEQGNGARLQQLLQRLGPLMLRRTKQSVARDLPPKTVISKSLELGDAQQRFYDQLKHQQWQTLEAQLEQETNSGTKQMLVLSALMKLRQACCDPRLLGDQATPSAKTEACVTMVEELVAEGSAILVFSQFTQMLDILASELRARGIAYLQLTGQSRNRTALVARFQAGEAPVFLISLKAGGTGLNLTRADTVIHFDPWWNDAAESQASDRAHRLGQTKPVFVYKLLAEGTIEEKIAALQAAKASVSLAVNQQAEFAAQQFALNLRELLELWHE